MIIDVLNRDIERLSNLNEENVNKEYKYKEKIKELKDNLSNEKKVRRKLEKIYEDLKKDNENLLLQFDGVKKINKILQEDNYKHMQKIQEIEKELEKSEECINIDAKIKDKAQKNINELNILKNMHDIDIIRNNEYTTGNLLDYDYFKKYYKLIAIDLSKQQVLQENEDLIQQINFIGRLEEAANVFIIIEKKEHTVLEFSQNFANVIY